MTTESKTTATATVARKRVANSRRPYVARPKEGVSLPTRMVEATHPSMVERHLGASLYTVEPIGAKEAIALAQQKVELEQLGEQQVD